MLSRSELYKTREYWIEKIQNDIFRALHSYKEEKGLKNNTALAKELGFSKGYISQIMNGKFNFSISKLVELALTLGVAPKLELQNITEFISNEEVRLERLSQPKTHVSWFFDSETTVTIQDAPVQLNTGANMPTDISEQRDLTIIQA